ncbi:hypothetical protein GCM10022222_57020 [Amycolatopsis ultiminotia]|uniref:Zinc-ribbon domain-containing protein n=1 Tax=Amycolatopsis ultiminotia TaxID=543629 RepID=A0ABP6XFA6_9PSEU
MGKHGCEQATGRIMLGRPLPGTVRETQRVMHVFPEPAMYPGGIVAFCGAQFWTGDLEWCERPAGMPCVRCLAATPLPPQALP